MAPSEPLSSSVLTSSSHKLCAPSAGRRSAAAIAIATPISARSTGENRAMVIIGDTSHPLLPSSRRRERTDATAAERAGAEHDVARDERRAPRRSDLDVTHAELTERERAQAIEGAAAHATCAAAADQHLAGAEADAKRLA